MTPSTHPIPYLVTPQGQRVADVPPTLRLPWVPTPAALRPDVRAMIDRWAAQDDHQGPSKRRTQARAYGHKAEHHTKATP
jgi:hypothetical protein